MQTCIQTTSHESPQVYYRSLPGSSYFNVDFHHTGRLPRIKLEVGGVNALASVRACYVANAHTFDIAYIIADGGCDRVWHRKLRRKGDSGQFSR